MWKAWIGDRDHPGGDGLVERMLPDGRVIRYPYYCDGPTPHLILKRAFGYQYGESRWYEVGEIAYLSEGLARLLVKRGFAEPVTID